VPCFPAELSAKTVGDRAEAGLEHLCNGRGSELPVERALVVAIYPAAEGVRGIEGADHLLRRNMHDYIVGRRLCGQRARNGRR
jgi:hypothetical protein